MTFFSLFISIVIIQRIIELIISRKNENYLKSIGGMEYDRGGYKYIFSLHFLFFISIISEFLLFDRKLSNYWSLLLLLFLIAQCLRYWAIFTLGKRWCTKIIVLPNSSPISTGPYKYMKHPNYLAVIIEIATIPLMFNCYFTAIIFSMLNLMLIRRRIIIEEKTLKHHV